MIIINSFEWSQKTFARIQERFSVTRKKFLRIFVFIFQVREKKREREGRAEIGEKDKAKRKERRGRERDQITVTDAFNSHESLSSFSRQGPLGNGRL
jgi:hypothetical protein